MSRRRVLLATGAVLAEAALDAALDLAGDEGEVVLATVVVVPHAQRLAATLDRAVAEACAVLDAGERAARSARHFDTRLLRARSFSEGVLGILRDEPFDTVVLQIDRGARGPARAQLEAVVERAGQPVVLVRPAALRLTATA